MRNFNEKHINKSKTQRKSIVGNFTIFLLLASENLNFENNSSNAKDKEMNKFNYTNAVSLNNNFDNNLNKRLKHTQKRYDKLIKLNKFKKIEINFEKLKKKDFFVVNLSMNTRLDELINNETF